MSAKRTAKPDVDPWAGDGIDGDDLDVVDAMGTLGLLPAEVLALEEYCRREAWVYEKLAQHEEREGKLAEAERSLNICRYHWRRAQRFKDEAKALDERLEENRER